MTPVPANEAVPIFDFFRPALFTSPAFNEAGTHLAAIISPESDRTCLLVHNLVMKMAEKVCGWKDNDIYSFARLDDSHLMFSVSKDNAYAFGRYVVDVRTMRNHPVEYFNATYRRPGANQLLRDRRAG